MEHAAGLKCTGSGLKSKSKNCLASRKGKFWSKKRQVARAVVHERALSRTAQEHRSMYRHAEMSCLTRTEPT